jgi:hypothetical protein
MWAVGAITTFKGEKIMPAKGIVISTIFTLEKGTNSNKEFGPGEEIEIYVSREPIIEMEDYYALYCINSKYYFYCYPESLSTRISLLDPIYWLHRE